jgi:hypothetical protein
MVFTFFQEIWDFFFAQASYCINVAIVPQKCQNIVGKYIGIGI